MGKVTRDRQAGTITVHATTDPEIRNLEDALEQAAAEARGKARVLARYFDLECSGSGDVSPLDPVTARGYEQIALEIAAGIDRVQEAARTLVAAVTASVEQGPA